MNKEYSKTTLNQQPDKLNQKHRVLMRYLVSGKSLKEACEAIGMSVQRASVVVNSELFQDEMDRMRLEVDNKFTEAEAYKQSSDPVREQIAKNTEKAAKTLSGALDDESGNVRISAAKEILDRGGYQKEDKVKANVFVEPSLSLINMLERVHGKDKSDDGGQN